MLHGTREKFCYFECAVCGALTLLDSPKDLERYYSDGYYSFVETDDLARPSLLRLAKTEVVVRSPSIIDHVLRSVHGSFQLPEWHAWGRRVGIRRSMSILDVGAGSGKLLHWLARDGFANLTGVDLFLTTSKTTTDGVRLIKGELDDVTGSFDLVMFHHSLEHMAEPYEALCSAERLLNPGGAILVRIPVADSWAYRNYGKDWFQIDPPRHLHVMTTFSISTLAARAGLKMVDSFRDSTVAQFWISECYRRDTALSEITDCPFTENEMSLWEHQTKALNEQLDGDQAAFIFRRQ